METGGCYMDVRPIHTEGDYKAVLRELSAYFENEPEPGTRDGDRFEILLTLVEEHEAKHYPVDHSGSGRGD